MLSYLQLNNSIKIIVSNCQCVQSISWHYVTFRCSVLPVLRCLWEIVVNDNINSNSNHNWDFEYVETALLAMMINLNLYKLMSTLHLIKALTIFHDEWHRQYIRISVFYAKFPCTERKRKSCSKGENERNRWSRSALHIAHSKLNQNNVNKILCPPAGKQYSGSVFTFEYVSLMAICYNRTTG